MKKFRFKLKTDLRFGEGEADNLGEYICSLKFQTCAVIVDSGVRRHPKILQSITSLKNAGITHDIYINSAVEPDYDFLDEFKKPFLQKDYDCIIGIGGGSTLDLTKGIATLAKNEGPSLTYRGFPDLNHRPIPVVAIPTTAGTGSEVTYNAVFTDSKQKKKLGINSELNHPVLTIVDPLITLDCPKSVSVSSGVDALVHTLESYVHKNHTPISRMYSKEAFRCLFNNLNKLLDKSDNVEVRGGLALGAYLAGAALINAGSGPSGAFSYPLGTYYKVPHGYAGAVFIPEITRINVEKGYRDYATLYDMIEGADLSLTVDEKNKAFAGEVSALMEKLGVPEKLAEFGLKDEDIEFMVDQYDVLKAAVDQNPIEITKEDVRKMMNKVFKERTVTCPDSN